MIPGVGTAPAQAEATGGTDAPLPFPSTLSAPLTIAAALSLWVANMERLGCKAGSIKCFERHARRCCSFSGWGAVGEMSLDGAEAWLAVQRTEGWSGPTHDQAASALRCFSKFLYERQRVPHDPFCGLRGCGEVGGEGARAATTEEVRGLIRAALVAKARDRRCKGEPAVFLAFLCWSGLREDQEANGIKWRDIVLGSNASQQIGDNGPKLQCCYTSDPAWAKNGKRQTVALNEECRTVMEAYRRTVPNGPDDPVFPVRPNRHTFQKLRELAGIRAEDDRGRGFNSLRKWLATTLDATGASPGVVSAMLRHSDTLAQEKYIDPKMDAQLAAAQRLPAVYPAGFGGRSPDFVPDTVDSGPKASNSMAALQSTPMVRENLSNSDQAASPMRGAEVPTMRRTSGLAVPSESDRAGNYPLSGLNNGPASTTIDGEAARQDDAPGTWAENPGPIATAGDIPGSVNWPCKAAVSGQPRRGCGNAPAGAGPALTTSADDFERAALEAVRSIVALRAARLGTGGGG